MNKWIDGVCRIIDGLIALMLAIMVVLVFGNVVLRYGFNSGIMISEEVSRWLFIWITFLGAVVALRERAHLGVDMLVVRLPLAARKLCLLLSYSLMLYIVWLVFEGSVVQTRINWDVQAPVTGASLAIVYAAGIAFAVGAALLLTVDLLRLLCGNMTEGELVAIQETEDAAALSHALHAQEHPPISTQSGSETK
ncbi:TRAP transporter small permease [Lampropedia puyangensis]|uniref:TRAP transporter small permease protein n=1 Tax=Lampropedia puyangensis TaxID=1330072 RepID=A0A4S8FBG3_9BURK|nr:TRAP transporter small permease [Lampropedia puyangensis]THU05028.1 TRAP transporter small permease [Lampropedia puyangensis]